jgi:hypothetical protein
MNIEKSMQLFFLKGGGVALNHANFKAPKQICMSISLKISLVNCYKYSGDVSFLLKKSCKYPFNKSLLLYSVLEFYKSSQ